MMRMLPVLLIFTFIFGAGLCTPAFALNEGGNIPVYIDGLLVELDVQPVILNGRVLVPYRAVAEDLNIRVTWEESTRTVRGETDQVVVRMQIDSRQAYLNEKPVILDTAPMIMNNRTLVPLRFFSEAFGSEVLWLGPERGVQITSPPKEMAVVGFYALGDSRTSSWTNLFGRVYPEKSKGNTDAVSELALGWYSMDGMGNLLTDSGTGWQRPPGWSNVLEAAASYNLGMEMVVHVTDKNGVITAVIADETAADNFIEQVMEEVKQYRGVNLNFEGLGLSEKEEEIAAVRQRFNRFVERLSRRLKAEDKSLTLTIHPLNGYYRGYDYRALGEAADRIIVMAYDYGPKPEPVNLVVQAVEMAQTVVPPEKLLLGISVPYETPESFAVKVGIAKRYNWGGIALWRLGLVSDQVWEVLRRAVMVI